MISNPDFKGQFDYAPYREFVDGKCCWMDVMSGDWVWEQAVWFLSNLMIPGLTAFSGHNQQRFQYPWVDGSPTYPRKRQNLSFECNWPKRVPPIVFFAWERAQLCLPCTPRCPRANWLLGYPKKYVLARRFEYFLRFFRHPKRRNKCIVPEVPTTTIA